MEAAKHSKQAAKGPVDEVIHAVEQIHRTVADVPFEILHRLGVMERSADEIKRIHDDSLTAIYTAVRGVQHELTDLADGILAQAAPDAAPDTAPDKEQKKGRRRPAA